MTRSGSKGISQSTVAAGTPNEYLQVTGNTGKRQGDAANRRRAANSGRRRLMAKVRWPCQGSGGNLLTE